jgi:hypothetical protein
MSAPAQGSAGSGGRSRLGWMLAGVVAIVAVAGVVVVISGDDGSDTPAAVEEADGAPATTPTTAGPPAGSDPEVTDAPADGTPAAEVTPVDVAEGFFGAVSDGDCQGIIDRMTVESFSTEGETPAQAVADCEDDEEALSAIMSAESWEVEPLSEDGDRAVVAVTLVVDGDETVRELPLERVDGVWKMDLDPTAVAPAT